MPRLLSVSLTEQAVIDRSKTVTRRLGWWRDKHDRPLIVPGDHLVLCRKVMGRKPDEPLVRLAEVEVVRINREPLLAISWADCVREGFPAMQPSEFVEFFTQAMKCEPTTIVTRIEWRYL